MTRRKADIPLGEVRIVTAGHKGALVQVGLGTGHLLVRATREPGGNNVMMSLRWEGRPEQGEPLHPGTMYGREYLAHARLGPIDGRVEPGFQAEANDE